MEHVAETGSARFNTNSLVMTVATAVILAAIGWVGGKSSDNNDKLTRMETSMPYLQASITEMKTTIAGLVTRPELEGKMAEIKAEQAKISLDILKLKMRIGDSDLQGKDLPSR